MNADDRTVSDLGEDALVDLLTARITPHAGEIWSGDDAAVVSFDGRPVVTVDLLVEGVDFDRRYSSGGDVGWKSLSVNASDIAAMGAQPRRAVCAVGLPGNTPFEFFTSLLDGLLEAGEYYEVDLVGGDISEASEISVCVTMIGSLEGDPIRRSGAQPGDALCVTGTLGAAAGGLLSLREGLGIDALETRQLRPEARVAEGLVLARAGARAMIDISDGFALDLSRLLSASGTGCEIDPRLLPIDVALHELAVSRGIDAVELALAGGEDFELLCALPAEQFETARRRVSDAGAGLTRVGTVTDGAALVGMDQLDEWKDRGWQHLRAR